MTTTDNNNNHDIKTLSQVDQDYKCLGCLGHGGFASVYLAETSSKRQVALKFFRRELDDDEDDSTFSRELDSLLKLDPDDNDKHAHSTLSIVFVQDWFVGPTFQCLVMQYADGGTLAHDIDTRAGESYTERRIAAYALQLAQALEFAHSRGVAHHDVKSSNILVDRRDGGRLLLCDFGAAIGPGETPWQFSRAGAPYELLQAFGTQQFDGLQPTKIDAFGLGCVLMELLCCQRLSDITEQPLAMWIYEHNRSAEAALNLDNIKLPWLPPLDQQGATTTTLGYSHALRSMVQTLLEHDPRNRYDPCQLVQPLQKDPKSPLLVDFCPAAHQALPGAPVHIDNVQLGLFVHLADNNGKVGVISALDPDFGYTQVSFANEDTQPPMVARIGARNKYELRVAPAPAPGLDTGLVSALDTDHAYRVGQTVYHDTCQVVAVLPNQQLVVAPLASVAPAPVLPFPFATQPEPLHNVPPRQPLPPPWDNDGMEDVTNDTDTRALVQALFPSPTQLVSIRRVQNTDLWKDYAQTREQVAADNWGVVNEQWLVMYESAAPVPLALLSASRSLRDFYHACHSMEYPFVEQVPSTAPSPVIVARVALGRVNDQTTSSSQAPQQTWHSVYKYGPHGGPVHAIDNPLQLYPEYIVAFQHPPTTASPRQPRTLQRTPPQPSSAPVLPRSTPKKLCVVCLERPVTRVVVPCGHPCFCQTCSSPNLLRRMRMTCPECRTPLTQVIPFYGTVVEEDVG